METDARAPQRLPATRYTARLKVMEEEAIANKLGEMAYRCGSEDLADRFVQDIRRLDPLPVP